MSFQLNQKKYQEVKEKEEKKKKKVEEDNKKKLLEEELKRRSQAQGKSTTTTSNSNTSTKVEEKTVKPSVKVEPSVREITPEEFEKNREEERLNNQKNSISNETTTSKIEIKYDNHDLSNNNKNTNNTNNTNTNTNSNNNIVIEEQKHFENWPKDKHNPNLPYETPDKNKSCISPNHPCLFSDHGVSLVKEIWTDEHGKTAIMPDRNHGGKMEKYFWGQPRVEENWITIPINSSVKGKEVKINATSNHLIVHIRGVEYINREFTKTINVKINTLKLK